MSLDDMPAMDRRRLLQVLGSTTVAGLAGCGGQSGDGGDGGDGGGDGSDGSGDGGGDGSDGNDGGDGGDGGGQSLGERVPTIALSYLASFGIATKFHENAAPEVQKALNELGVDVEITPKGVTRAVENTNTDARESSFMLFVHGPSPDRLDPQEMTIRYSIDWAGNNGKSNTPNYASCAYSAPAHAQANAESPEQRREMVNEAHRVMSEDKVIIPILPQTISGAVRSDQLDVNNVEVGGITRTNPWLYLSMEPQRDTVVANVPPVDIETMNFLTRQGPRMVLWNGLPHTPLLMYDENLDITEALAESYDVADGGTTVTVNLDDATFHNGDPITSEEVKFTYTLLRDNIDTFPKATEIPYESIETPDDSTVVFNLTRPHPSLITREFPKWGILHKQSWVDGGAVDDPGGFNPDTIVGSGPFQIADFQRGNYLELSPHDGNPVASPDYNLVLQAYQDTNTAIEAFISNEIQVVVEITEGQATRIRQSSAADQSNIVTTDAFMPYPMYPQCSFAPTQFPEFRDAVGASINREVINQVAYGGAADVEQALFSDIFMETHPFRPPEDMLHKFTDDPSGNIDQGRSVLEDAGWGWDDQGRLHYPPDADLSPMWPAGETPSPDDFACLNEDGQFTG